MAALALSAGTRLVAQGQPRPRHKVSAAELHRALAARFPLRLSAAGLLEMEVHAPALLLLPASQEVGATLQAQLGGTQLRRAYAGEVDLAFSLRYQAADRTVRGHAARLHALRLPGLAPDAAQAAQAVLGSLAREALAEIVLHRFTARELALPETMGVQPETLTVVDDGLVIEFGPR